MKFNMENLGEEGRSVQVHVGEDDPSKLWLSVGFVGSHAGYAPLTRSEALALAGTLSAMARSLERE